MTDTLSEELAFPVLFPKCRFGYTAERHLKFLPEQIKCFPMISNLGDINLNWQV